MLSNGPWPTRSTWLIFHTRYTRLADVNAYRTLQSLVKEGSVDVYVDESGEENWRDVRRQIVVDPARW